MLILIYNDSVVGVTEQRDNLPQGYKVVDYPSTVDARKLYYDPTTDAVALIPPRPEVTSNQIARWSGTQWVVTDRPNIAPPPKDAFIGTVLYRWAQTRAKTDNAVMLLYVTACCADAIDNRDELKESVKQLRDIRNANINA